MTSCIGILDGAGKIWGVRFPDFPGVHGAGITPDDAMADATSALREVSAIMFEEGRGLPKARSMAEVLSSDDAPVAAAGEIAVLIPWPTGPLGQL